MRAAYRLRSAYTALVWLIVYTSFHLLHDNARAWDDVSWTAAGDDLSWSAGDNWSSLQMPTTGDRVLFTDVGASSTVGVTTSVLDSDVEIGALEFQNGIERRHTIDLANHTLHVDDMIDVNSNFFGNTTTKITNGTLTLGSSDQLANLTVVAGEAWGYAALDLSGAHFDASLSSLIVGQDTGHDWPFARFDGGSSGTISVGTESQPGTLAVGHSIGNSWNEARANLSQQDRLDANLDQLHVGVNESGLVDGTLVLARKNLIHADSIRVAYSATPGKHTIGDLYLGNQCTIDVRSIEIGVNGSAILFAGALADSSVSGNSSANLGEPLNGRQDSTVSPPNGSLVNNDYGTLHVGTQAVRGALVIGKSSAQGRANGTVYLNQADELVAYLDRLEIGVAEDGTSDASVELPSNVLIDVPEIHVGEATGQGSARAGINLGHHTVIDTDRITIGFGSSDATITAPYSGELLLGSPQRPVDLTIAAGRINGFYRSQVDLSKGTTTAYLGDVAVGQADLSSVSTADGRLSFGLQSQIEANRIVLAQGNANGTLDFRGGRLTVDEISKGTGNAQFNWTGGRIEIGRFGTEVIPFNLSNQGEGTLAAAAAFDAIHIYGNYAQALSATFEASEQLGAFRPAVISGAAKLAGTLDIQFEAGFHPAVGETFTILTASSIVGTFARVTGFLTGDTFLNPIYHSTYIELQAYRAGDSNLDGFVDGADYTKWAAHFLQKTDRGVADGDYNGDGLVNGADYILWADHFYVGSPSTVAAMAVPEPSTLALASLGILLMAAVGRGRQAN